MNPMNMNQMGMNQMNMNQIGMNQIGMNQIGINNPNQMNSFQMDNTTLNIKNIVQPYEKKIKELEEIIRQKEFEITVLRQKLNINNPNNNFINIIPNPLMESNIQNKGKPMRIKIKTEDNEFDFNCFELDKVSLIREKFNIKGFLSYNFNVLYEKWSFNENRIHNYGAIIYVKQCLIFLVFKTNEGNTHCLSFSDDCPIGIALINYIIKCDNPFYLFSKINGKNYSKKLSFLYNGSKLNIDDDTPIGRIFKNNPNPRITVNYIYNC